MVDVHAAEEADAGEAAEESPAEPELEEEVPEAGPPADVAIQDEWEIRGNLLVRIIYQPRTKMFTPLEVLEHEPLPVPLEEIDCERHARTSSTFRGG